jgi:hypothetical protein
MFTGLMVHKSPTKANWGWYGRVLPYADEDPLLQPGDELMSDENDPFDPDNVIPVSSGGNTSGSDTASFLISKPFTFLVS